MSDPKLDELCINAIRFLAVDAVQKADSGHPGTPMGAAPMAYVLWDRFLKHNPSDPKWPDRDRFILSPGHASAMLYALLHFTGYDLPLEELKRFRQWGSKTPGHPEYGLTAGVEMTTGPLDGMDPESVDSALRMAQAEKSRPSLVICRTVIGYGSPNKAGTASAHGEPLGEEEVRLTRERLGWPYQEPFAIPQEALDHLRQAVERGRGQQSEWQDRLEAYRHSCPEEASQLEEALRGDLPRGWDHGLDGLFQPGGQPIATRDASGQVMNALVESVHSFTGGSADLAPSPRCSSRITGTKALRSIAGITCTSGSASTPWVP